MKHKKVFGWFIILYGIYLLTMAAYFLFGQIINSDDNERDRGRSFFIHEQTTAC
ncbi:hypothetical protein NBRC111894_3249 [Sporolactobacillus inulinus]|uniref:Uncharacterized protein n=1 Tax=Sporolactobacillus inulinus TaxID=2078 RepID=A0A4Y1ZF52_9BACL|nr:hypothetical protein [Sporolactobacillus inulinus]GAY77695.1 hypothetical protein NBRC111894_3249 [Sporolactobacillus inulinus]